MARKSSVERANKVTGGFATAQKNIVIQYGNKERNADELLNLIKADALAKGISEADFDKIDVYVKPEEQKVFYVVNEDINGSIDF
ncbi:DUF6465 family protein [Butyrivibrio sp. YAB3001]|uniref:DUF6465 family protein n=1 Tax=Butyrivibrio sp. YAB3001 TaxID=1520812 RepID=UPI0008F62A9F|nr:DUF6465 family protein [Butyrivibrio sp. YAB3001]SFC26205.1 hypothetical protein SAMN02910398_01834 [Butyrivibrio sp. YAB3001]